MLQTCRGHADKALALSKLAILVLFTCEHMAYSVAAAFAVGTNHCRRRSVILWI